MNRAWKIWLKRETEVVYTAGHKAKTQIQLPSQHPLSDIEGLLMSAMYITLIMDYA